MKLAKYPGKPPSSKQQLARRSNLIFEREAVSPNDPPSLSIAAGRGRLSAFVLPGSGVILPDEIEGGRKGERGM